MDRTRRGRRTSRPSRKRARRSPGRFAPSRARLPARRSDRAERWRRSRRRARRSERGGHRPWHGEPSECEDAAVPRYRHVLSPFDGSPDAALALEHAVAIAQTYRARLSMVAVVPPPPLLAWQAPGGMRGVHDAEQTELAEALRVAADGVPDDLSVTTQLLDGDPARTILRVAREGDHDVIVMGSRGRGRVSAALLGSVSNRVMHDADVLVIVIHFPHDGPDLAA